MSSACAALPRASWSSAGGTAAPCAAPASAFAGGWLAPPPASWPDVLLQRLELRVRVRTPPHLRRASLGRRGGSNRSGFAGSQVSRGRSGLGLPPARRGRLGRPLLCRGCGPQQRGTGRRDSPMDDLGLGRPRTAQCVELVTGAAGPARATANAPFPTASCAASSACHGGRPETAAPGGVAPIAAAVVALPTTGCARTAPAVPGTDARSRAALDAIDTGVAATAGTAPSAAEPSSGSAATFRHSRRHTHPADSANRWLMTGGPDAVTQAAPRWRPPLHPTRPNIKVATNRPATHCFPRTSLRRARLDGRRTWRSTAPMESRGSDTHCLD